MPTPAHESVDIVIRAGGRAEFIYSDAARPFMGAGPAVVRRASHVEPDANGNWTADLSPVSGPVLGPFALRQDALAAEMAWIRANVLANLL